jgi:fibronectin type III domain protein
MRPLLVSVCTLIVAALLAGCGQPGAPQAPSLQLPQPVTDLKAVRKGDKVTLTWTVPTRTTDNDTQRQMGVTRVCRTVIPAAEALKPTESSAPCANPIVELPPSALNSAPVIVHGEQLEQATMTDTIPAEMLTPKGDRFLQYSVEVRNERGKSAGASNGAVVSLRVSGTGYNLRVNMSSKGPELAWNSQGGVVSFMITRTDLNNSKTVRFGPDLSGKSDTFVGGAPVNVWESRWIDSSFEWEKHYRYTVAGLPYDSKSPFSFESEESNSVDVFTHDSFPPAVPVGVQAVYSEIGDVRGIDLTWNANNEDDLAGYIVYRRASGEAQWTRVSPEIVKTPTFRDTTNLQPATTYEYAVSAVDVRGNESAKSAVSSEKAAP